MLKLEAQKRDAKENLKELRKRGKLPAVFYGAKEKSTPISIDATEFGKIWKQAGESTIVTLSVGGKDVDTLVHDVAFDPVTDDPIHSDFYVVDKTKKVEVDIPLEFVGVSPAVEDKGGQLVKVLHEIEVEGFPHELPNKITVDISKLAELHDSLYVKDLALPEGVSVTASPDEVVATVSEQEEEPEEEPEAPDLESIEVEEKGKADEEEREDTAQTSGKEEDSTKSGGEEKKGS